MRILLTAGYGGHAGYAYAVAHELVKAGFNKNIVLIAEGYDFIAERFKGLGEIYYQALPRRPGEPLYKGLGRWLRAFHQSVKLGVKHDIEIVFSGGSNFSIPPSIVCRLMKRSKIYTLETIERFTEPARAVKLLEKFGARIFLHWDDQLKLYPKGIVVGPVYEPAIYEPRDEGYILVTTGTLGYRELFNAIEKLGLEHVVMQTGDVDPKPYMERNPSWMVFRYTSDIHRWIAGASLVITHQGGVTTSTASLAYGKPVIIVWNPRISLGAPRTDVEIYAEKIDAKFIAEPDTVSLKKAIEEAGKPRIKYPNGAEKIAKILLKELIQLQ